ncbi:MAG TPA: hypothetical protein VNV85_17505 [Puia sp.]|jgi:hypothetical protein|nr:hypothetical protein [Puia sp.]
MHTSRILIPFAAIRHSSALMIFLFVCCLSKSNKTLAQTQKIPGGRIFHFTSAFSCFPEAKRLSGYTYDSQFFDFSTHYKDSSVLMVVPDKLQVNKNGVDIVFWFHGWHNNIDTALKYYHLASQFVAAKKNAVLILAEAAKNAPDSYGGKLEQPNTFERLLQDALKDLRKNKIIPISCKPGNIMLAGHSGAYRVIAYMLQNGAVDVKEVELFDALYSETDKFLEWIKKDTANKFINFYTNTGGGTDQVSMNMMGELHEQKISFLLTEENNISASLLRSSRIIFIHSTREHNDIIFNPDNFQQFLEASPFLSTLK